MLQDAIRTYQDLLTDDLAADSQAWMEGYQRRHGLFSVTAPSAPSCDRAFSHRTNIGSSRIASPNSCLRSTRRTVPQWLTGAYSRSSGCPTAK
jgi:hypothetical protein